MRLARADLIDEAAVTVRGSDDDGWIRLTISPAALAPDAASSPAAGASGAGAGAASYDRIVFRDVSGAGFRLALASARFAAPLAAAGAAGDAFERLAARAAAGLAPVFNADLLVCGVGLACCFCVCVPGGVCCGSWVCASKTLFRPCCMSESDPPTTFPTLPKQQQRNTNQPKPAAGAPTRYILRLKPQQPLSLATGLCASLAKAGGGACDAAFFKLQTPTPLPAAAGLPAAASGDADAPLDWRFLPVTLKSGSALGALRAAYAGKIAYIEADLT